MNNNEQKNDNEKRKLDTYLDIVKYCEFKTIQKSRQRKLVTVIVRQVRLLTYCKCKPNNNIMEKENRNCNPCTADSI